MSAVSGTRVSLDLASASTNTVQNTSSLVTLPPSLRLPEREVLTALITGGTGTFGSAMAQHLLTTYPAVKVRIFSRDELKQHELRQVLGENGRISYLLGDVRDVERLRLAFRGVDLVIHAAALKQVPAGEYNPSEVIATNIDGTSNVVRATLDCGVAQTILLSSDKSVAPVNLYGASKMAAERLIVQANSYSYPGGPRFNVARYGNVANSRGSVLQVFTQKLARGELLPLTDQRMTRFWMSIDEAIHLVLFTAMHAQRGEVFVPELPAFQMVDLLRALLGQGEGEPLSPAQVEMAGKRPGEKLHEALLNLDEIERCGMLTMGTGVPVYIVQPTFHSWGHTRLPALSLLSELSDARLAQAVEYCSQTWPWRLSVADIRTRLGAMGMLSGGG